MGRLMSQELDRHRPLWEVWMVEGLPDDHWAIISKVHHCMVDGVSGADLMATLLDPSRDPSPPAPDTWTPAPEPSDAHLVVESLGRLALNAAEQTRAIRSLVRTPQRAATQLRENVAGLRYLGRELMPRPALSIQGRIGPHRRWACAHAELADIKAIKQTLGGTVNDVVLAVVAGAFRDLLTARSEDPDHAVLRSLVPVSIRPVGDGAPNNQVSAMIAELPIGIADPLERLASTRHQMDLLKQSHQAETNQALTTLAGLAAPSLLALGLRAAGAMAREFPQRSVDTVTTNVAGPQHPLYGAGRRMIAYLPFVPLAQGVRIGVAIMSYDGGVSFGVTGDYDTVPDLDLFCRSIETGISNLHRLSRQAAHRRAS